MWPSEVGLTIETPNRTSMRFPVPQFPSPPIPKAIATIPQPDHTYAPPFPWRMLGKNRFR